MVDLPGMTKVPVGDQVCLGGRGEGFVVFTGVLCVYVCMCLSVFVCLCLSVCVCVRVPNLTMVDLLDMTKEPVWCACLCLGVGGGGGGGGGLEEDREREIGVAEMWERTQWLLCIKGLE